MKYQRWVIWLNPVNWALIITLKYLSKNISINFIRTYDDVQMYVWTMNNTTIKFPVKKYYQTKTKKEETEIMKHLKKNFKNIQEIIIT